MKRLCDCPAYQRVPRLALLLPASALLAVALGACLRTSAVDTAVALHIDGTDRALTSAAPTVRALLDELAVDLEPLDIVEPPLWSPLSAGTHITVTRRCEEYELLPIPPAQHTVRDEFLSPAASRVITAGVAGSEQFTYLVTWDGPALLGRELTGREIVSAPVDEWRVQGTLGTLPTTAFSGTIAYCANGDAWLMRGDNTQKRRLTDTGGLDERVFALSPDGRTLLYTQRDDDAGQSLNRLWALDTVVLNAHPVDTGLRDVLHAVWSPVGDAFACSGVEATGGLPGWRALNDLRVVTWPALQARQVLSPTSALLYAWWGEQWHWSPNGQRLAYARPDGIGVLDLASGQRRSLVAFEPAPVEEGRVWLPQLAWAPDGSALLATVHRPQEGVSRYDLLWLDPLGGATETLYADVARDAALAWSPSGGVAVLSGPTPAEPRQVLVVWATDWQTPARLPLTAPCSLAPGMLCWALGGDVLLTLCDGDLALLDPTRGDFLALTASGLVTHAVWRP